MFKFDPIKLQIYLNISLERMIQEWYKCDIRHACHTFLKGPCHTFSKSQKWCVTFVTFRDKCDNFYDMKYRNEIFPLFMKYEISQWNAPKVMKYAMKYSPYLWNMKYCNEICLQSYEISQWNIVMKQSHFITCQWNRCGSAGRCL